MRNGGAPPPVQILVMKGMTIIGKGQEFHQVKPFSYEEEHYHKRSHKSLIHKGLVNDAMSKALDRISKSPFTRKIKGAKLPQGFHQPTFTMYNG